MSIHSRKDIPKYQATVPGVNAINVVTICIPFVACCCAPGSVAFTRQAEADTKTSIKPAGYITQKNSVYEQSQFYTLLTFLPPPTYY